MHRGSEIPGAPSWCTPSQAWSGLRANLGFGDWGGSGFGVEGLGLGLRVCGLGIGGSGLGT